MAIETTYRSYTLRFNEDDETWGCSDLKISDRPTLKACKAAIDLLSKKERRLDVKALWITGGAGRFRDNVVVAEITVNLLCHPSKSYGDKSEEVKECWASDANGERHKLFLSNIFPLDQRADIDRWLALVERAKEAIKVADDHEKRLTRHNADTLVMAAREAKAQTS